MKHLEGGTLIILIILYLMTGILVMVFDGKGHKIECNLVNFHQNNNIYVNKVLIGFRRKVYSQFNNVFI